MKNLLIIIKILLFLILLCFQGISQNTTKTDSLENRLDQAEASEKAEIFNNLAKEYYKISLDKSTEYSNKALALAKKMKNRKEEAGAIHIMGVIKKKEGNYEAALDNFNIAIKISEEIGDDKGTSRTLNNIGSIHFYRGNFNEAIEYYEKALVIRRKLDRIGDDNESKRAIGINLNQLGNIYVNLGIYEKAIKNYEDARKIFKKINYTLGISSCLNNCGLVHENWGNYDKAIEYYQKVLKLAESTNNHYDIANSLNNIGNIYARLEQYDKALENYQESLKVRVEINDKPGIAAAYNNIGIFYTRTKEHDKALEYYSMALSINKKLDNKPEVSKSLFNIGEINDTLGNYTKALMFYQESLKLCNEINLKSGKAIAYNAIGILYNKLGDHTKSIDHLNKSLQLSVEMKEKDAICLTYKSFSTTYEGMGDISKALDYYKKYSSLKDSVINDNMHQQIADMQTKYETEKKEQQIELLNKENLLQESKLERQKIYTYAGVIVILMILTLVFLTYSRYREKNKANKILEMKNELITRQKQEITDSIVYARRIQTAILPPGDYIRNILPHRFILFKPRDIVSGDFYWMKQINNSGKIIATAADCTGHGVPGAFLSMLGVAFLNEIVSKTTDIQANEILNQLREKVITSLHQTGKLGEAQDGMDIALCVIDLETKKLQYAGANNPLYLLRNNEIREIKGDKMPIGIHSNAHIPFINNELQLEENDRIYLFSDGFADQFGGPKEKKYKYKPFKKLLLKIHSKSMDIQHDILEQEIIDWQGELEQVDDILVMGLQF